MGEKGAKAWAAGSPQLASGLGRSEKSGHPVLNPGFAYPVFFSPGPEAGAHGVWAPQNFSENGVPVEFPQQMAPYAQPAPMAPYVGHPEFSGEYAGSQQAVFPVMVPMVAVMNPQSMWEESHVELISSHHNDSYVCHRG